MLVKYTIPSSPLEPAFLRGQDNGLNKNSVPRSLANCRPSWRHNSCEYDIAFDFVSQVKKKIAI